MQEHELTEMNLRRREHQGLSTLKLLFSQTVAVAELNLSDNSQCNHIGLGQTDYMVI